MIAERDLILGWAARRILARRRMEFSRVIQKRTGEHYSRRRRQPGVAAPAALMAAQAQAWPAASYSPRYRSAWGTWLNG
jgi:hypothetical protein